MNSVGAGSIYDEDETLILGFVKSLIMFFQIEDKRFSSTKDAKIEMKTVLNETLKEIPGEIQIKDFKTWYKSFKK